MKKGKKRDYIENSSICSHAHNSHNILFRHTLSLSPPNSISQVHLLSLGFFRALSLSRFSYFLFPAWALCNLKSLIRATGRKPHRSLLKTALGLWRDYFDGNRVNRGVLFLLLLFNCGSGVRVLLRMKGPLDRTKVVLRHLPPTISQSNLVEHIDLRFSGRYRWLTFRPGKSG